MAKTKMSDKEKNELLEEKVAHMSRILNEALNQPKMVGNIVAGPFKHEKSQWYRVEINGNVIVALFEGNQLFEKATKELKRDTKVMLVNGLIVQTMPNVLEVIKEKPKFDLINWNQVGGLKSQVERIRKAIEVPFNNMDLMIQLGLKPSKGVLLYGPPGCGKTLIAKVIASMILKSSQADEDSFVYIKGAELLSWYVGMTEHRIIDMFKKCREYTKSTGKRSVIFIDEAEAILPRRGSMKSADVDKTIVPTFLSEMDGFDEHSPMVILSTNLPESIDSAILRPGRIDIHVEVTRPTKEDAEEIFGIHLNTIKCAEEKGKLAKIGAEQIFSCELKNTVSGAMVESIVKSAGQNALHRKINNKSTKLGVTVEDLMLAVSES